MDCLIGEGFSVQRGVSPLSIIIVMLMLCAVSCASPTQAVVVPTVMQLPTLTESPTPTITLTPSVTWTYTPTTTPSATSLPPPTFTRIVISLTPSAHAQIPGGQEAVTLYALPNTTSSVIATLPPFTLMTITAKTPDNLWLRVTTPQGESGWIAVFFVEIYADMDQIQPVEAASLTPSPTDTPRFTPLPTFTPSPTEPPYGEYISGITVTARNIFLRGQELGNRADVFAKVGDSITASSEFLFPFGRGVYNLYGYDYLYPALRFFSQTAIGDANTPFDRPSLAAGVSWTTQNVLNPHDARAGYCNRSESPLVCEYRTLRPATALIMFGSNDAGTLPPAVFRDNLSRIMDISIDMGVIPVLSTIPAQKGRDSRVDSINAIIVDTAHAFDTPLWDYHRAMNSLPGRGLSEDGIHPSSPQNQYGATAEMSEENLRYGYTLRNLMALQVLDALMQEVLTYDYSVEASG